MRFYSAITYIRSYSAKTYMRFWFLVFDLGWSMATVPLMMVPGSALLANSWFLAQSWTPLSFSKPSRINISQGWFYWIDFVYLNTSSTVTKQINWLCLVKITKNKITSRLAHRNKLHSNRLSLSPVEDSVWSPRFSYSLSKRKSPLPPLAAAPVIRTVKEHFS